MPRYLEERTLPKRFELSGDEESAAICAKIVINNSEDDVTWIHSYISHVACIYEAPSPEAIRGTAARNELPVDRITRVSVLDPYFLH